MVSFREQNKVFLIGFDGQKHQTDHWILSDSSEFLATAFCFKTLIKVLLHFYKLLLLSSCGFLRTMVLVKRAFSYQFCVQKSLLPPGNLLPSNYEKAYSIIKPFLVKSLCFHACPCDCVLFRDSNSYKYSALVKSQKCGLDRFLSKNMLGSIFIYLPLGPRFGRLCGTASLAQVVQSFATNEEDDI